MLAAAARCPLLPVVLEVLGLAERAELGVVAHEAQAHQAGGTVAVLRDLELDDALGGRVAGVFVEEHDHVGVLLDGARLAQVGELRLAVGARLGGTVELRDGDHRHVELAGQLLHGAGDVGDLLLAVFGAAVAGHELEIVDDDQRQGVLGLQAARLGAQLEHVEAGGVVDEDVGLLELSGRLDELRVVVSGQAAGAHLVRADARRRAHHALAQFLGAHLEAEDRHRRLTLHRHVLGDGEGQGRLADAGPRREDDEIGFLEAARELVDALETAGDAAHAVIALQGVEVLEVADQDLFDVLELGHTPLLLDGEDLLLAAVEELVGVAGVLIAELRDLVADADEGAQHALLAHDAGVVGGVGRRRHELGQGVHELAPPGALEHALALELGAEGDHVDLFALVVQGEDGAVDEPVRVAVEVVGRERLRDGGDGVRVDEHGAEDRLLGLEVVRREMACCGLKALDCHMVSGGVRVVWNPQSTRRGAVMVAPADDGKERRKSDGRGRLDRPRPSGKNVRLLGRYSGVTMVLTEATKPSATSTSTMKAPSSLMGSSSSTLRLSIVNPRASLMASAMSAPVMEPNRRAPSPALAASVSTVLLSVAVCSSAWTAMRASRDLRSSSRRRNSAILPGVAGSASLRGIR